MLHAPGLSLAPRELSNGAGIASIGARMWNLRRVDGAFLGRCNFGREYPRGYVCATDGAEHWMEGSVGES